ncbi:MAG: hypothetical protein JAY90_11505 [Candidatus Thiodiazotropha lotti]|nr:hypothetical protein [Candidatus Thiodiazotropha lotti]
MKDELKTCITVHRAVYSNAPGHSLLGYEPMNLCEDELVSYGPESEFTRICINQAAHVSCFRIRESVEELESMLAQIGYSPATLEQLRSNAPPSTS